MNHEPNDTVASIVFARNESLVDIDCNKLFKDMAGKDGRGGGTPQFVTGIINGEKATGIVRNIVDAIDNH